ncbi:recombinase family protein [Defluviitalea phaphyphila]|uniref:recombinase family protein n=1 Tax=Defluviitalea phaphyphila TaxID=1473580 RepID=UPI0007304FC8|nr:recombinase family protein [Defluviitalea phaphyphila]
MSIYGYCRCSTDESRQDIDRQRRELKKLGVKDKDIYFEYVSGRKLVKVEWEKLMERIEEGDTIATTEVSRISRSTKQLCEIIEMAQARRIKLIIGGLEIDCSKDDPMTKGMVLMWGVFAELEAAITSHRVKSGMANAREKGAVIGRPKTTLDNLPIVFLRHYPLYNRGDLTLTELAKVCGISRQSAYKYKAIYEEGCV